MDEPPAPEPSSEGPPHRDRTVVFRSGRRIEAELVRSRLEADGLGAGIWSSGLGLWRMESGLTEVTGVPTDFNAHQVVVNAEDEGRAREVLADPGVASFEDEDDEVAAVAPAEPRWRWILRNRWLLIGFALVLLVLRLLYGPVRM
ncbi:MAG: hypothetical protein M3345_04945 [Actinomycetota bacterium]|nr:hypothetical protein [Actinomycetota bacterium]